jgi:hypothetical protein
MEIANILSLLTNSMGQIPSSEANSISASQSLPHMKREYSCEGSVSDGGKY